MENASMQRHSSRIIALHWLTLALLGGAFVLGKAVTQARESGSVTLTDYQWHLVAGLLVLAATALRLFFRRRDGVPASALQPRLYQALTRWVHRGLYAVLILVPLSGMATVRSSAIGQALSAGNAALLPASLQRVTMLGVHKTLIGVLVLLVTLHVLAALKHQFVNRDRLLARMGLGRP